MSITRTRRETSAEATRGRNGGYLKRGACFPQAFRNCKDSARATPSFCADYRRTRRRIWIVTYRRKIEWRTLFVEEIFVNEAAIFLRSRSGWYIAFIALGQTEVGRYLTVVYERKSGGVIRVVTAFDMDEKNKRRYHHERRRWNAPNSWF